MMWGWGSGWGWLGAFSMIVFWGGLIFLAVWAVRRLTGGQPEDTAEQILEERFARGEIDRDELESRRRVLHHA